MGLLTSLIWGIENIIKKMLKSRMQNNFIFLNQKALDILFDVIIISIFYSTGVSLCDSWYEFLMCILLGFLTGFAALMLLWAINTG